MDENIFITGQIKYTKEFLLKANKTFILKSVIPFIICSIISVLLFIYIFVSKAHLAYLSIPLFILVLSIVLIVRLIFISKRNIEASLKSKPNSSITYNFTLDNFFGKITSDTSTFEFNKKYSEIKKVIEDKECYYIFFDDVVIPVNKSNLNEDKQKVLLALIGKNKRLVKKDFSYYLLIILFIFTILSPFIAMIFIIVAIANSPIPEFPNLLFKYSYIFYIFAIMLIFPIASIVYYFIYHKKVKCKKNLIGGIIVAFILASFSTASLLNEANVQTDKIYLSKLENTLNIDFPDDYQLNYVATDQYNFTMMVKFNSKEDILNVVTTYPFVTSLDSETIKSLPEKFSVYTITYDYLLTFNLDNKSFNTPIIEKGYLIGFNVDNNILECQGFSR